MPTVPIRQTKQRQVIYDIVMKSHDHPSCDMIYERALKIMPNISLGTVYRNLAQLVEANQIKQISMPNAPDRYDYKLVNHQHFICTKCGNIFDVFADNIDGIIKDSVEKSGHSLTGFSINAKGICKRCLKKL